MTGFVKFKVDPDLEAIGLYRDPNNNDEALADPFNHLDKAIFHPAFRYCGIVQTFSGTFSLPAVPGTGTNGMTTVTRNLLEHGQSGRPMMFGVIKSHPLAGGADVAWMGSIPIAQHDNVGEVPGVTDWRLEQWVRWLTLGVNDTHIVVHDVVQRMTSGTNVVTQARDVDYEIHILDVDLESALPSDDELSLSNATGVIEIRTPNGMVSMARRYIRKVTSGGLVIPGGKTINTRHQNSGDSNPNSMTWRCKHGALHVQAHRNFYSGDDAAAPDFTPRTERVTF